MAAPAALPTARAAFLHGLVDYAGLFPPAQLDLQPAIEHFARYRQGERAWMLGRFIIPTRRLADLTAHAALFEAASTEGAPPFRFSVLGTPAEAPHGVAEAFERDLEAIRSFEARHEGRVRADFYEVRLPLGEEGVSETLLQNLGEVVNAVYVSGLATLFFEVPDPGAHPDAVQGLIRALHGYDRERKPHRHPTVGYKMRCGGVTPDLFPSPETVAAGIATCRTFGVPFKATAGLHHPVRHHDDALGVDRFGFVNVFAAGVLAHGHQLDAEALFPILIERDLTAFELGETLRWRDLEMDAAAIAEARAQFAISYGSCSFDEPIDDLRAAGWLV